MYARFWPPETIQNSLSPQTKSRICSPSGRMTIVVNRSLACSGTTDCGVYVTSRADCAAAGDVKSIITRKNTRGTKDKSGLKSRRIEVSLTWGGLPVGIAWLGRVNPARSRVDVQIEHLGQIRPLHEHLLFRNQLGDEVGFG